MKVLEIEFLEAVVKPGKGSSRGVSENRLRDGGEVKSVAWGPGVAMWREDSALATIVPWENVRFALVQKAGERWPWEEAPAPAKARGQLRQDTGQANQVAKGE